MPRSQKLRPNPTPGPAAQMPGGCLAPARSLRTSRAPAVLWSGGFSCPRAPAKPAAGRERPPLRRRDGASKAYVKGPPTADNPVSEQYAPFISALSQTRSTWLFGVRVFYLLLELGYCPYPKTSFVKQNQTFWEIWKLPRRSCTGAWPPLLLIGPLKKGPTMQDLLSPSQPHDTKGLGEGASINFPNGRNKKSIMICVPVATGLPEHSPCRSPRPKTRDQPAAAGAHEPAVTPSPSSVTPKVDF